MDMHLGSKRIDRTRLLLALLVSLFAAMQGAAVQAQDDAEKKQPNILFLVVDDMGFSDIGPFGSEIETPNLDALARGGMMFTNFHTQSTCSPSRSMMLTGVDNHRNGLGTMDSRLEGDTPQKGKPGYEGVLNQRVVTIAKLLRDNGYHTYQAGKWHLGHEDNELPRARGFERNFTMVPGGGAHLNRQEYSNRDKQARYNEDFEFDTDEQLIKDNKKKPLQFPDNFYSTKTFTDKLMGYIKEDHDDGKPFFVYACYTAPHAPLQVPDDYLDQVEKYQKVYEAGWDKLRADRFERMKIKGLIPDYLELPPRWDLPEENVFAWDSLEPGKEKGQRDYQAKLMAIYAAMIQYADDSVGRWIEFLKDIDEYDDTIIVFISDNGADAHDNLGLGHFKWVAGKYENKYEDLGTAKSFQSLPTAWAEVAATPFYGAKGVVTEGGIHGPMIVHYPNHIEAGTRTDAYASVLDLAPTWLEYAGVELPDKKPGEKYDYKGREVFAMDGRSMRDLWTQKKPWIYGPDENIGFELYGSINKALFKGDWKVTRVGDHPFGAGDKEAWKLFNLRLDPRELIDLSSQYPERTKEMVAAYNKYEKEVGFVSMTPEPIASQDGNSSSSLQSQDSSLQSQDGCRNSSQRNRRRLRLLR